MFQHVVFEIIFHGCPLSKNEDWDYFSRVSTHSMNVCLETNNQINLLYVEVCKTPF